MSMAMADGHTWQRYEGGHAFILMVVMSAVVPAVVPAVMSFLLLSMAGVIATFFGVYEPRLDDGLRPEGAVFHSKSVQHVPHHGIGKALVAQPNLLQKKLQHVVATS